VLDKLINALCSFHELTVWASNFLWRKEGDKILISPTFSSKHRLGMILVLPTYL